MIRCVCLLVDVCTLVDEVIVVAFAVQVLAILIVDNFAKQHTRIHVLRAQECYVDDPEERPADRADDKSPVRRLLHEVRHEREGPEHKHREPKHMGAHDSEAFASRSRHESSKDD